MELPKEIITYQTALQRLRKRQHMLVFDGFHQVNSQVYEVDHRKLQHMQPTISALARYPVPIKSAAGNKLVSTLANEKIQKI